MAPDEPQPYATLDLDDRLLPAMAAILG